jgi:hypothetical protein
MRKLELEKRHGKQMQMLLDSFDKKNGADKVFT